MNVERGQMTIVSAAVVALALAAALAVALVGSAMIDRTGATIAADATALAGAVDPTAGETLAQWYRDRGVGVVSQSNPLTTDAAADRDRAVARSRAVADTTVTEAPVIHAVIARASQLLGRELVPLSIEGTVMTLTLDDAIRFEAVAAAFAMCPIDATTFEPC